MKRIFTLLIISVCVGCASAQVQESRDLVGRAHELLARGAALSEMQEQEAQASFMQAKQLASEIMRDHPDSPVAHQIFLESLFGLAQLDPTREDWYSFQAVHVAAHAQKTFTDERFTHLFCYYLAKALVGARMSSEPLMVQLSACVTQALESPDFLQRYPKHREHLLILYQHIR